MGWGYCRYNLVSVIIDAWLATCVRNKSNILLANKYWHDYDWFYVTSPFLFVWKFFPHLCKTLWCKEIGFRYVFPIVFFLSIVHQCALPMFIKFSLLLLLTSPMLQAHDQSLAVRCFQCSEFPSEPEDQDEPMGPCPGNLYWRQYCQ